MIIAFGNLAGREWRVMSDDYAMSRFNKLGDKLDDESIGYIQKRLKERVEYKRDRDYNAADEIRDELRSKYGVAIDDRTREWSVEVDQYTVVDKNSSRGAPQWRPQEVVEDDDNVKDDMFEHTDSQEERNLADLTVPELKEKLKEAGLPVSGRKAELIERLTGRD
jgi:SAP domain